MHSKYCKTAWLSLFLFLKNSFVHSIKASLFLLNCFGSKHIKCKKKKVLTLWERCKLRYLEQCLCLSFFLPVVMGPQRPHWASQQRFVQWNGQRSLNLTGLTQQSSPACPQRTDACQTVCAAEEARKNIHTSTKKQSLMGYWLNPRWFQSMRVPAGVNLNIFTHSTVTDYLSQRQ